MGTLTKEGQLQRLYALQKKIPFDPWHSNPDYDALYELAQVIEGDYKLRDQERGKAIRALYKFADKHPEAQELLDALSPPAAKRDLPPANLDDKGRVLGADGKPKTVVHLTEQDKNPDRRQVDQERMGKESARQSNTIAGIEFSGRDLDTLATSLREATDGMSRNEWLHSIEWPRRPRRDQAGEVPASVELLEGLRYASSRGLRRDALKTALTETKAFLTERQSIVDKPGSTPCADGIGAITAMQARIMAQEDKWREQHLAGRSAPNRPSAPRVFTVEPSEAALERVRVRREQGGDKAR